MSDAQANLGEATIKFGGQENVDLMRDLEEIVVETSYNLPAMALIRLHDPDLQWVDDSALELGKAVEIELSGAKTTPGATGKVFSGEIVALEPEFTAQAQHTLLIRAYDKTHRLHIGRKFQTFLQQSDSDIVSKVVQGAGLTAETDPTGVVHEYVLQNNQTDMEFLVARARRNGFQLLLADGKVQFKKTVTVTAGVELVLGEDLRLFRPRVSAARQPNKFVVQGWDYVQKKEIVGQATPQLTWSKNGITKTGGAAANSAFSISGTAYVVDSGPSDKSEADKIAAGFAVDADGEYIVAEGVSFGDASIQAGKSVTIKEVGTRFSGDYLVTSATHIYNKRGYEVHFTVSGRLPNTVNMLLNHPAGGGEAQGRINGVVVGMVTNNKDPDNLGRVKVKYSWMPKWNGAEIESHWARISAPMAGPARGFYYLPEINDEVLLAFEQGDPTRPYIVGMLWNGKDKPPEQNAQAVDGAGKVIHRILQTRVGHKLVFDDSDDKPSILLQDKTGNQKLLIDSTKNSITITANGDLTIDVKGNILIKAAQKIDIQAGTSISEKANTDYSLEALNAKLKANAKMDLEAVAAGSFKSLATTVEATGTLNLKANGPTVVKGLPITLN